jgi:hypothetical protein
MTDLSKPLPYWRRDGTKCGQEEFLELHGNRDYRLIAEETVGTTRVTTVWLGYDYEFIMGFHEKPQPFGTLVLPNGEVDESSFEERYETEDLARRGHAQIVGRLQGSTT